MFNSTKLLIALASLLAFCTVNAQNYQPDLVLNASHFKALDSLDELQMEKTLQVVPLVNIKAEYWDNTKYNPYQDVELIFPLRIRFDDSSYTSPIGIDKVVTSRFGWRRGRGHKGIDIDLVTGDSIYTMFDGIVRFARYNTGHGKTVVVRHYNGLETTYAHLSKYAVKENDTVKAGDFLGHGGATGNARGSHLHLVINYKGISINPEYLFDFDDDNTIRAQELWVTKKWTRPAYHNSRRQSKIVPLLSEEEAIASLEKQREVYIVKPGDTLSRISLRNNVTIRSICTTNAIRKNSVLRVGQKLIIEK
ncbi:M23 family metallopeptidase [Yeosuana sp. MJ-SS3]|uniref:M23 family metallopeptidase n=1 Tax=Gilvirhabdus luticola TaxID=3079858 RepID=A0ABU3U9M3_9FLAO|nr:M23 family metallopeptidase [Yeosuana sp. MJ-SS3]MDU8887076.1 M23 family metallopeptidase [Yeosuana sp. MJ-SS3]